MKLEGFAVVINITRPFRYHPVVDASGLEAPTSSLDISVDSCGEMGLLGKGSRQVPFLGLLSPAPSPACLVELVIIHPSLA